MKNVVIYEYENKFDVFIDEKCNASYEKTDSIYHEGRYFKNNLETILNCLLNMSKELNFNLERKIVL